ncbi:M48 family metallopeptidase [Qipengyuania nanhaisediminis]|uniref:M48 family metallopeptidase n=1 Tax=Qipengyuania nanhaisediminis TaxID=604088 RepID=UPI0038B251C5
MIDWLKRADLKGATEPEIALNGATVPIVLRRHKTARRLTLRLAPDGSAVRITLPAWARPAEAIAFAHARREWLEEQHAKIPQRRSTGPGSEVLYRGEGLAIEWDAKLPRKPSLADGAIRLGGPSDSVEKRVARWLETEALRLFRQDAADYTAAARLEPVPVAISRAQRRWGSCSDKERIRINWRLVQAPDFVRRSVVAHEVAHLVHFDHSPAFHALLGEIYEGEIARADRWLKQHGRSLYAAFG